jgi:type II restriction enzyme
MLDVMQLQKCLVGKAIPVPASGTLSGHAAGEPFDKWVYQEVKKQFPKTTFRQYEFLNDLFKKNPKVLSYEERLALFNSPTLMFLLSRGKQATLKWSEDNLFEEKQNDTADIIIAYKNNYQLLDVKTRNLDKKAQAPNIISAYKLAQTCAIMIENKEFTSFSLDYLALGWRQNKNSLICEEVDFASLFQCSPEVLYINWAAAMQVQFHVHELPQSFSGTTENLARSYLKHFVAKAHTEKMIDKFVRPFEKYL